MKKITFYFFIILFFLSVFFLVKKYFFISEKEKILKALKIAENSLEKKDYITFIKQFSLQYRDDYGNTWGTLFLFLRNNLHHCKKIEVSLTNKIIKIKDKEAEVKFFGKGKIIWENGEMTEEAGRFIIKLQREGNRWKIVWFGEDVYTFD